MLQYIYTRPLWQIWVALLVSPILWAALRRALGARYRKVWLGINILLAAFSLAGIFAATLAGRTGGRGELVLRPLADLGENPERLRMLLMNGLLFEPLGLGLPELLPHTWSGGKRFLLTVLAACILSLCLESAQYHWGLGRAETDDVIMNTLGAAFGSLGIFFQGRNQGGSKAKSGGLPKSGK